MAKVSAQHRCTECGYKSVKALGRCPNCGAWDSFKEEAPAVSSIKTGSGGLRTAVHVQPNLEAITKLVEVPTGGETRFSSGIGELDRVLGGGFVPGEVL
ncbi:MAG: DNA repair protein RadA, partial [Meiothermus sp.]